MNTNELPQNELLESCKLELEHTKDQLTRLTADFDNYQRRVARERFDWEQRARIAIVKNMLPIIDDIIRGQEASAGQQDPTAQAFSMVAKAAVKFLENAHIQEIKCVGQLDPALHEAVMQVSSTEHASGDIVAVLQKGFTLDGVVIRPAQVSVAS